MVAGGGQARLRDLALEGMVYGPVLSLDMSWFLTASDPPSLSQTENHQLLCRKSMAFFTCWMSPSERHSLRGLACATSYSALGTLRRSRGDFVPRCPKYKQWQMRSNMVVKREGSGCQAQEYLDGIRIETSWLLWDFIYMSKCQVLQRKLEDIFFL